jgi:phosphoribosylaminoimidazole-succinocarboxamide synthase
MPDHIEGKGAALCLMGAYCFEQLEKLGVKTHYRGLVNSEGKAVRLAELEEPFKRDGSGFGQRLPPKNQHRKTAKLCTTTAHITHRSKTASYRLKSSTATASQKVQAF